MFVYQWFSIVSGLFVVQSLIIDSRIDQSNRDFSHLEMVEDDEIPLEVIQQVLENVTNFFDRNSYKTDESQQRDPNTQSLWSTLNQFMNNNGAVNDDETDRDADDDESTFRSENVEKAKWAKCEPEVKSIKCSHNPKYVQLPSCIRVKQCGGCCIHSKLECKPTSSRRRLFEVQQMRYIGNGEFANATKELIQLDEHLACKCLCKITASDCSAVQVYNQKKCQCECRPDSDDRTKCLQRENAERFVWDENLCECRCRHYVHDCGGSSAAYFDTNRCQCVRSRSNPKRLPKPNNYSNLTATNVNSPQPPSPAIQHKYFYSTNSSSNSGPLSVN